MTTGSEGNAEENIKWPENDKGTLLCDVCISEGFDSLFLTMQGGLNHFRVRLHLHSSFKSLQFWIVACILCAGKR